MVRHTLPLPLPLALSLALLALGLAACDDEDAGPDADADIDADIDSDGDGDSDADGDGGGDADADGEPGCPSGELRCEGSCVTCPTELVSGVGCDGATCVVLSCQGLRRPCEEGCCPWTTEEFDPGGGAAEDLSMAADRNGGLHVAYYGYEGGMTHRGRLRYALDLTGTWSSGVVDETSERIGNFASIAVDPDDRPHVAYHDFTNRDLRYARLTDEGWQAEVVDAAGSVGEHAALALDEAGAPHIVYSDATNDAVVYSRLDGATWTRSVVAEGAAAVEGAGVVVMPDGVVHVVWVDDGRLFCASGDGASWSAAEDLDAARGSLSAGLSPDGEPAVVYLSLADVMLARLSGGTWDLVVVDSPGGLARSPSLAFDSSGRVHLAYLSSDSTVSYATERGAAFAYSTVVDGRLSNWIALAVDSDDRPRIIYVDELSGGGLTIAR